jgi:hypothetical protein
MPSRRAASARLPIGDFLYLVSIGFVAVATGAVLCGSGFLLLIQPRAQIRTETVVHDRGAEVDPQRSTEPSDAPSSKEVPSLGSTASEVTIIGPADTVEAAASVQPLSSTSNEATFTALTATATQGVPSRSLSAIPLPPPLGRESDHPRKLSRPPHSRSDKMPREARAAAAHTQSAKEDRKDNLEGYAAASANQHEYNQLRATGSAVNLTSEALNR